MKVNLSILGVDRKAEGKTLAEALSKFDLSWETIKGKGIMTITDGNNSYEHLFNMKVLRRIFSNKIVMGFWVKNLEMFLKSSKETNIPKKI